MADYCCIKSITFVNLIVIPHVWLGWVGVGLVGLWLTLNYCITAL